MISFQTFLIISGQTLEYTLFQPGLLLDYWAPPGATGFSSNQELWIDFNKRRAITLEGNDGVFTLTTASDLANIVVQAINYAGEWPVIGGVHGTTTTTSKILEIGAKIGSTFRKIKHLFCLFDFFRIRKTID